jgi:DNA replication protein DnaC
VLTASERRDLLEILEDRQGCGSTIISSQLPVGHWHDATGDPTPADAILDRLVRNAHRLPLAGESMRKRAAAMKPLDQQVGPDPLNQSVRGPEAWNGCP